MYLEEFVEVSLKLVDPNSCGDKRPWKVERSCDRLVSTGILVAFKYLERLICFDETITIVQMDFSAPSESFTSHKWQG